MKKKGFVEIDVLNSPQTVSKSIDNYFFLSHFRETKNGTPTNSQVELQTHRIG